MKDYLNKAQWWNQPPLNPVQTMYRRFQRTPQAEFDTPFQKLKQDFKKRMDGGIKTAYTELWEKMK